jgi:hypothetical protein
MRFPRLITNLVIALGLVALILPATGCDPNKLKVARDATAELSRFASDGRADFADAAAHNLIEADKAAEAEAALDEISQDTKQASDLIDVCLQAKRDPNMSERARIVAIADATTAALDRLNTAGVLHIKNPDKQRILSLALFAARATTRRLRSQFS